MSKKGSWIAPVVVALLLLAIALWGLWAVFGSGGAVPTSQASHQTTVTPTPTVSALKDLTKDPTHIWVKHGDEKLVDADIVPVQLDSQGWLYPPSGVAGWYGPPQWDTIPGNLSTYRGIIVGHNVASGEPDTFAKLGEVQAGDVVVIKYGTGSKAKKATFEVTEDASSVDKTDVISEADSTYKWVWESDEPERAVTLFSCDLAAEHDSSGHSLKNWIVQAQRIG